MKAYFQSLLEKEIQAVTAIPITDAFEGAVNLIYQQVHERNGKVVTSGMGKAGQIANNIATTLSSTGSPAIFIHAGEAQHGDLGVVQKNDVLFLVSNSGKTREALELVDLARNLYPEIPIVAITGQADSPLTKKADITLLTGNPAEICPLGLTPTASTTAMTVIGDLVVVALMKKINFSREEYAKRHHGGYLGAKAAQNDPA